MKWDTKFSSVNIVSREPSFRRNRTIGFMAVGASAWNSSVPTGLAFVKTDIWILLENPSKNCKFHSNLTTITGTLHENLGTFMTMSCSVLLSSSLNERCFGGKLYRKSKHPLYVQQLFSENHSGYEIMLKNIGEPQMTKWRMRIPCWIPKATDIHSECVICAAFPRQQWFLERDSVLCLYVLYLSCSVRRKTGLSLVSFSDKS